MSVPDADAADRSVWRGRFLEARVRGRWEYAARTTVQPAAVILAIDDGHVLLVEQYRVPLDARTVELPAGLVGDEDAGEALEAAAIRELEEETGYRAAAIDRIGIFATSPGMTSERFALVRARGLTHVGPGGGVAGEDITVHRVALADIAGFIADRRAAGAIIDARLLLLLGSRLLAD